MALPRPPALQGALEEVQAREAVQSFHPAYLGLALGERVSVRRIGLGDDQRYSYGETMDGRQGLFPSGAVETVCRKAVLPFDGDEQAGYLKLALGDRVSVRYRGPAEDTQNSEWSFGSTVDRRRSGWFPSSVESAHTSQVWLRHRRVGADETGRDATLLRLAPDGEWMVGGSCDGTLLGGDLVQLQRCEGEWALVRVPPHRGETHGWIKISHLHAKDPGPAGVASRAKRASPTSSSSARTPRVQATGLDNTVVAFGSTTSGLDIMEAFPDRTCTVTKPVPPSLGGVVRLAVGEKFVVLSIGRRMLGFPGVWLYGRNECSEEGWAPSGVMTWKPRVATAWSPSPPPRSHRTAAVERQAIDTADFSTEDCQ